MSILAATTVWAGTGSAVQDRLDVDTREGQPIVVHVVVALCDNANQGIVPVPASLGNGQDPRSNLYWGALFGVRTHLSEAAGWKKMEAEIPEDPRILDRVVLYTNLKRGGISVPVYVVADAWDGAHIREALQAYLRMAAGSSTEKIEVGNGSEQMELRAGGSAHLLAYVGHNGLMEFSLETSVPSENEVQPRSAVVLACMSKSYFLEHLQAADAHPLLLTTGLMAPEAYTLDSAIRSWVEDGTTEGVMQAAAVAYDQYQGCGLNGARRLFWGAE
ncbi:MAG: hypothetical protein KAH56_10690 [Candidatus Krumholzibacteria bacterium]|nr:hypothetical protein [Candidatus Krumholzibacteria bacterium]